jgi:hypothetical protein
VKRKASGRRQPVWLTPEAIAAAGRLSQVTGLSLHELIEAALLGVDADELGRQLVADGADGIVPEAPPEPSATPARPPARVIPIAGHRRRES